MERLAAMAAEWRIKLSTEQLAQFAHYQALLLTWNERINLTAIREPEAIQERHFLNSLICATVMGDLNGRSLIDIGTGAGFPGLPLKLLYPHLRLTLVDSVGKKARFLETVVAALALTAVTVINERAEVLGQHPDHRERYDWAIARGVARLPTLAEYLLPLCRVGGYALAQKGKKAPAEAAAAANAVQQLGGDTPQLNAVQIGKGLPAEYLVVIAKVSPTPPRYPRRVGIPAKRPLT